MRISGWSSDVCSSDLSTGCVGSVGAVRGRLAGRSRQHLPDQPFRTVRAAAGLVRAARKGGRAAGAAPAILLPVRPSPALCRVLPRLLGDARDDGGAFAARDRKSTSELQSLMRISYAVFCLKKKTREKTR